MQFRKREKVRDREKDRGQSRRSGQAKQERKTEQMWESDRGQERRKGGQESKGVEEDKKDGGGSLFLHQITDFAPTCTFRTNTCTYIAYILPAPTHPLHYTVALDSGSKARCVRRQGCGLEIQLLFLLLRPSCLLLLALQRHAWLRHIIYQKEIIPGRSLERAG